MNRNRAVSSLPSAGGADPILDDLLEELTAKLQAGETVDIEDYVGRYPEHAELIRQMVNALAVLDELGHSVDPGECLPGPGREPPPSPGIGRAGRLPDPPRDRPGRDGGRLRGRADLAGPARGPEGPAVRPGARRPQLQRFQNEAQAAAHLHHPNIVPVYAVGCERGVHYYAMQYIEGQSLSALIEELRRIEGRAGDDAARPRRRGLRAGQRAGLGAVRPGRDRPRSPGGHRSSDCRAGGEARDASPLVRLRRRPTSSTGSRPAAVPTSARSPGWGCRRPRRSSTRTSRG